MQNMAKILKDVPSSNADKAKASIDKMISLFPTLESAIEAELNAGAGSEQQQQALDDANVAEEKIADELSVLEECLVPPTFKREIPSEYSDLPALQGRANLEIVITRPSGEPFDVDGKLFDKVKMLMTVDGYNAPLTAGNFVDLANKHFYDKKLVR
jgi:peptidylprolyl isomerase